MKTLGKLALALGAIALIAGSARRSPRGRTAPAGGSAASSCSGTRAYSGS